MSAAEREFDIVLYGATGFVGKLTAEYLARAGGDARIALAGRSHDKLQAVLDGLGDKDYRVPIGEALRLWFSLLTESALPAADDGSSPHRFLYFP